MKSFSIAFYNVENFYARHDITLENESFIVGNKQKWNQIRYATKLTQIAKILNEIGREETNSSPAFIGISEVENEMVLEDLISHPALINENYDYVFFPSLDERRINVALLYKKDIADVLHQKSLRVVFNNAMNEKTYTRDVLLTKVDYQGEILYFFVVHLPSKRDGVINQHKRKLIMENLAREMNVIFDEDPKANIVIMGDFNDTPTNSNLIETLNTRADHQNLKSKEIFNPFVKMMNYKTGTINYKKQWLIFDQMLFSKNFVQQNATLKWEISKIFNPNKLLNFTAIDVNLPIKTFEGKKYIGGPSDHFPIYSIINLKFDK